MDVLEGQDLTDQFLHNFQHSKCFLGAKKEVSKNALTEFYQNILLQALSEKKVNIDFEEKT